MWIARQPCPLCWRSWGDQWACMLGKLAFSSQAPGQWRGPSRGQKALELGWAWSLRGAGWRQEQASPGGLWSKL